MLIGKTGLCLECGIEVCAFACSKVDTVHCFWLLNRLWATQGLRDSINDNFGGLKMMRRTHRLECTLCLS